MKSVTSKVTYKVPNWNFCNHDNLFDGDLNKMTCSFCQKQKNGTYKCLLYNKELCTNGRLINKLPPCIEATISSGGEVEQDHNETRQQLEQSVDTLLRTIQDLMKQGYPYELAQAVAKEYVLSK